MCYNKKVKRTKIFPIELKEEDFREAVEAYVRKYSDTYSKLYELISTSKFGWYILKSFDNLEEEYLDINHLCIGIPQEKRPTLEDLEEFLLTLGTSDYNEIIRYNRGSKRFSISTPFFRAYLKMKFALEKTELQEKKQKRKNKSKRKFDLKYKRQLVIDDDFFQTYYQFLDNYQMRFIKLKSKLIKELLDENKDDSDNNDHKAQ